MIKSISAFAIFALVVAAIFILPGFAAPVEPTAALAKGDRLLGRILAPDCSKQIWPDFTAACLHGKAEIVAVRLIPARG